MAVVVEGAFSVEHIQSRKRAWLVVGGELVYEDDYVKIIGKSTPPWETDFGSIPDIPILSWMLPGIGDLWDEGFEMHDLLWLQRVYRHGEYSIAWTNSIMKEMHKFALDRHCDGKPWYVRYWARATGWLKINAMQLGVQSTTAKHKWEHPEKEVSNCKDDLLEIIWKKDNK